MTSGSSLCRLNGYRRGVISLDYSKDHIIDASRPVLSFQFIWHVEAREFFFSVVLLINHIHTDYPFGSPLLLTER